MGMIKHLVPPPEFAREGFEVQKKITRARFQSNEMAQKLTPYIKLLVVKHWEVASLLAN